MVKTNYYVYATDEKDYFPELLETFTNKAKALAYAKTLVKRRRAINELRMSEGSHERNILRYAVTTNNTLITPDPAQPWLKKLDRVGMIAYRL